MNINLTVMLFRWSFHSSNLLSQLQVTVGDHEQVLQVNVMRVTGHCAGAEERESVSERPARFIHCEETLKWDLQLNQKRLQLIGHVSFDWQCYKCVKTLTFRGFLLIQNICFSVAPRHTHTRQHESTSIYTKTVDINIYLLYDTKPLLGDQHSDGGILLLQPNPHI